ncbi:MAG: AIR synthase-related protein, partial [Chloroflexi bacterium]|nr:AIR synthase-related protein [Chloroflexota bacterium]
RGDVFIGLPSSGLHTNGYSLVRRIFGLDDDPSPLHKMESDLGTSLGEALLAPHAPYYSTVKPVLSMIKGMSHITGGGLYNNIPRALPKGLGARVNLSSWDVPAIFNIIQHSGNVERDEMFRVFNMGLGMVLICAPEQAGPILQKTPKAWVVGEVVEANADNRVILN